jgi:hypothetical protein
MLYKWLMFAAAGAIALAFVAGGADARPGQRCGGIIQITCGPGEWCQPNGCHPSPRRYGHCVKWPEVCPMMIVAPVCGCNGQTFSNDCWRIHDKVALKHKKAC